jgi:hypothetical protein
MHVVMCSKRIQTFTYICISVHHFDVVVVFSACTEQLESCAAVVCYDIAIHSIVNSGMSSASYCSAIRVRCNEQQAELRIDRSKKVLGSWV